MSQEFTVNATQNIQEFSSSFSGVVQSFTANLTQGVIYVSQDGGVGGLLWGGISGDISNQTDLVNEFSKLLGTGETAVNSLSLGGQNGGYYLNYGNLTGVPTGFIPVTHQHSIGQISGLEAGLSGKLNISETGSFYSVSNPSGYITGVNLSTYSTIVFVTGVSGVLQNQISVLNSLSGSYILTSQTGQFYSRTNPSGFITGIDLSNYATTVYVTGVSGSLQSQILVLNNQTGNYFLKSSTGQFYPITNPSGYITGVDLSNYVTGSVIRPSETGAFYPRSNPSGYTPSGHVLSVSGSLQTQISNLSSATGTYVSTSQTGQFYPVNNPSGYITGVNLSNYASIIYVTGVSGSLQSQISTLNNQTGSYVLDSETGLLVASSQTGAFYPRDNPSGYITGVDLSSYVTGSVVRPSETGNFITSSQTGQFYSASNPSGFITGVDLSNYATQSSLDSVSGNLQNQIDALGTGSGPSGSGDYYPNSNPSGYLVGTGTKNVNTLRLQYATVTVSGVSYNNAQVVVSDPLIGTGDIISASFLHNPEGENDAEEILDSNLSVYATAGSGQINFFFTANHPFMGPFLINYSTYTP